MSAHKAKELERYFLHINLARSLYHVVTPNIWIIFLVCNFLLVSICCFAPPHIKDEFRTGQRISTSKLPRLNQDITARE
jgi:hypothetical protein